MQAAVLRTYRVDAPAGSAGRPPRASGRLRHTPCPPVTRSASACSPLCTRLVEPPLPVGMIHGSSRRLVACASLEVAAVTQGLAPSLSSPLIQSTWGVWAVLLSCGAGGLLSEKYALGRAMTAPLVATILALILSNAGVISHLSPVYNVVNKYILTLAIPLLLFSANLGEILRKAGKMMVAFIFGAFGTLLGTVLAYWVLNLGANVHEAWKIAASLCARHIGGAVNYVAVSDVLQMSPNAVATGLAADNCVCVVYFLALFALARMWGEGGEEASERKPDDALADAAPLREGRGFVTDCSVAVAASASICAASSAIVSFFGVPQNMLAVTTALVVLLASVFPSLFKSLSNTGEELAAVLLQIFFAAVGAAAGNIMSVLQDAPFLFLFCLIQIFVHLGFILAAGKLFKLEVRQVLVASNANIGGPTTAAAFINTFGWRQLLVPGILVGILGYAVATFLSVGLGYSVLRHM